MSIEEKRKLQIFLCFLVLIVAIWLGSHAATTYSASRVPVVPTKAITDYDWMGGMSVLEAYPLENPRLEKKGYHASLDEEIVVVARNFPTWLEKLADDDEIPASKSTDGKTRKQLSDGEINTYGGQVCLFLNEQPFPDLIAERSDTGAFEDVDFESKSASYSKTSPDKFTRFVFRMRKTAENSNNWMNLLKGQGIWDMQTDVSIGFYKLGTRASNPHMVSALNPKGIEASASPQELFSMRTAVTWKLVLGIFFIVAIAGVCLWAGHTTDLLRDSTSPVNPTGRYPFSLGMCQMAFWTLIISASFVFLLIVMGDYQTVSPGAVTLMGISAATGLSAILINQITGGVVIDKWKDVPRFRNRWDLEAKIAQANADIKDLDECLANAAKPANTTGSEAADAILIAAAKDLEDSKTQREADIEEMKALLPYYGIRAALTSFAMDLLKENSSVSFHRFQLIVWTAILGGVFVYNVIYDLVMPDYSASLLILVGISSGTYIGFKMPAVKPGV